MSTNVREPDGPPRIMAAARLHSAGSPLIVEQMPVPTPGHGHALVQVLACGVCGSDAHMARGTVPVRTMPIVLGHEAAGRIAACGADVTRWKTGDAVIVRAGSVCGECRFCSAGADNLCPEQSVLGMDADGGFAQYVTVPAPSLVPLPVGMPFEIGAILTDAVATPYHALTVRGALREGESVAVFGAGGVGMHAVQLARVLGAGLVIAVDVRDAALVRAKEAGAHETVLGEPEAPYKAVQRLTGGGVDLAVDCVGRPETIGQAVRSLRPGGRAVIVGMGQAPISLPPPALFAWREHAVIGSFGSTRVDLDRVLGLVGSGRLDLSRSITGRLPLRDVNRALAMLEDRESDHVRIVIEPWEGAEP